MASTPVRERKDPISQARREGLTRPSKGMPRKSTWPPGAEATPAT
ncbi:hypothetical protein [Archangium gephyra]